MLHVKSRLGCVWGLITVCMAVFFSAGCGERRPTRVPVSGQVLLDGRPLTEGTVMFVPQNARPSSGKLDGQGRFKLTCYDGGDGAVLGKHAVRVMAAVPATLDGVEAVKWIIPKKYSDCRTSGLEVNVNGPVDSVKIELTWAGGRPFIEK